MQPTDNKRQNPITPEAGRADPGKGPALQGQQGFLDIPVGRLRYENALTFGAVSGHGFSRAGAYVMQRLAASAAGTPPQGLKPRDQRACPGTAEAVP